MGHENDMSVDEVKLFVNTMVAAYNATTKPTVPVITNTDKSTDNMDTDFLYVDYDATVSKEESKPFGNGVFTRSANRSNNAGVLDNTVTKRVFFTLKNNSIVLNKRMTVHYYPAIYNSNGDIEKVLTDYPLPLTTYLYTDSDNVDELNAGSPVTTESVRVDIDNNGSMENVEGSLVQSNDMYYVDVPILDEYFNNISYSYTNALGNLVEGNFEGLDEENHFAIQIQVVMRYGKDLTANKPLVGIRNAVFMRRGMFLLD